MLFYPQEPCCRRKAILSYFGEKSPKCQQTELPCDYCYNSKQVCKASSSLEEALQAKALAAATPPKTTGIADSHMLHADCSSGNHKDSASSGTSPSASNGMSSPVCKPQSAAVWRTAASKRPAPVKPLLSQNRKLQAVAAQTKDDDKCTEQVPSHVGSGSQAEACSSGAMHMAPQAGNHASNLKKPVLKRARFKVPFKVPRSAG